MMEILSGQSFYGQHIGVLVFANISPRVPGDAGHANSFNYPVRYEIVKGSFKELLDYNEEVKTEIKDACMRLKACGIRGVIGDCGMMSLYQDCLGAEVDLPFVGSSLCQIPTVWQLIGRTGTIGILTGHSGLLSEKHLRASGWTDDISIAVKGLQEEPHFKEIIIDGGLDLNVEKMNRDVVHAAMDLQQKTPDLKAIIIECSNLPTYAKSVSKQCKVPVFDTMSAANLLAYAVNPPSYITF